jgi:hypothetical protein
MNTLLEMIQGVQSDLNVTDTSPLFPLATVKSAINRAYIRSSGLFKWPGTEDAKKTSTQANLEYYDYPNDWRDDSVWRIEVDGVQYGNSPDGSPMKFEDYLIWRADSNNANSTEKKWANQKRRYFIYPVPTTAGSYNISVWGQRVVTEMTANTDYTIFSYSMPECNDAIVMEAAAILKGKGEEDKAGEFRSAQARSILAIAWNKIQKEQAKYEKDQPFFDVPDFFGSGNKKENIIGNF